jgi:ABC-2 type transport system ATP-binding protein
VAGRDIRDNAARHDIGFLLEADGLYDNISAFANLVYYARLYDMDRPGDRINDVLKQVGLAGREQDKVGTFSRGMRQRLGLARALVPDPDLLVLDEPTAGVDPTGQIEFRGMLQDLMKTKGKTVLLSSHNLDEVQRICNRIALIHQGEIKLYGELAKLQRDMGRGGIEIESREAVPPEVLAEVAKVAGVSVREQRDKLLYLSAGRNTDVSEIVALLTSRGVRVEQFKRQDTSLEDLYTSIVREAEK